MTNEETVALATSLVNQLIADVDANNMDTLSSLSNQLLELPFDLVLAPLKTIGIHRIISKEMDLNEDFEKLIKLASADFEAKQAATTTAATELT